MAKLKFKDENNNFIPVVQDVKVNGASVFDGEDANVSLRTINNQSIVGTGNIDVSVDDVVKTTANQGLSNQQKINARNNIEALGSSNIKQGTGTSTTDVISQKGVTDLLADKQNRVPNGTNPLISLDTGKLDLVYMPATVLGGITNGGTFNGQGIITASSYAPELQGEKIDEVQFAAYPSYYFICSDAYSFAGYDFAVGDWAISLGNGWAKLNATDAVTSVNGKMGQVVLDYSDVGAAKSAWGNDNANKNLVTDASGNVITSDYALGQISVDYYSELPTNVPEGVTGYVQNSTATGTPFSDENPPEYNKTYENIRPIETPTTTNTYTDEYVSFTNDERTINFTIADWLGDGYNDFVLDDDSGVSYVYLWEDRDDLTVGWYSYDGTDMTPITYGDIPNYENYYLMDSYYEEGGDLLHNIQNVITHYSGNYRYSQVQPATNPKTYYWKYEPSGVQSDWNETNPLAKAYIKNKPTIPTKESQLDHDMDYATKTFVANNYETISDFNTTITADRNEYRIKEEFIGVLPANTQYDSSDIQSVLSNFVLNTVDRSIRTGLPRKSDWVRIGGGIYANQIWRYDGTTWHRFLNLNGTLNIQDYGSPASISELTSGTYYVPANTTIRYIPSNTTDLIQPSIDTILTILDIGGHKQFLYYDMVSNELYIKYGTEASYGVTTAFKFSSNGGIADYVINSLDSSSTSRALSANMGRSLYTSLQNLTVTVSGKQDALVSGTNIKTINNQSLLGSGNITISGGGGSVAKKKALTNSSSNYSESNGIVTVTDSDVTVSTTDVQLFPADIVTERWLENNLVSCVITQSAGLFSFEIDGSLPASFSMYYIITEVQ